jgi:glucokinase
MILVGDIGATKINLALFPPQKSGVDGVRSTARPEPAASQILASADHDSLEAALDLFLAQHPAEITAAAFGVPGPVVNGVCRTTNLPWIVRRDDLAGRLGAGVEVLNDLVATARGIALLRDDERLELQAGSSSAGGTVAVIAAGTGLGQTALLRDETRQIPISSEGGHADFAPRDEVEVEIWRWLRETYARVEYEMLLSGPGLVNLYLFFHQDAPHPVPWGRNDRHDAEAAAAVSRAAMEGACPACRASLERFVSIYGAEAGNLALKMMATGGVYIAGGIAPKILPVLRDARFLDAFNAKGSFSDLMRSIPVQVVLNTEAPLLGALSAASVL